MLDQTVFDNITVGTLRKLNLGVVSNILLRRAWREELDTMIDRVGALTRRFNPAIATRLADPVGSFTMIDRRRVENLSRADRRPAFCYCWTNPLPE